MLSRYHLSAGLLLLLTPELPASPVSTEQCKTLIAEAREDICHLSGQEGFLDRTNSYASFQPSGYSVIVQQFHATIEIGGRSPAMIVHQFEASKRYSSILQLLERDNNCVMVFYRQPQAKWPLMVDVEAVEPDHRLKGTMADFHPVQMCFNVDCQAPEPDPKKTESTEEAQTQEHVTICCLCRDAPKKTASKQQADIHLKSDVTEAMKNIPTHSMRIP